MRKVLYPGSFDPVTNGHMDLIARASKLFDQVIVVAAINGDKNALFTIDERVALIKACCQALNLDNVEAVPWRGLTVNAMKHFEANAILRGLRAFSDFEYELQMALINRSMDPECETIFLTPTADNSYVSSRMIKEIAALGGNFSCHVPPVVEQALLEKMKNHK